MLFRSESCRDFLGPIVVEQIERIMCKPITVLGDQRQRIHGNWKLYAENTRDPYHASLLHLFHNTFGLYRSTQTGKALMDSSKRHSLLYSIAASNDDAADKQAYGDSRTFDTEFKLQDMSLLKGRQEFDDNITLVILAVYPNLVLQQIQNTLAVRQTVTYGPCRGRNLKRAARDRLASRPWTASFRIAPGRPTRRHRCRCLRH